MKTTVEITPTSLCTCGHAYKWHQPPLDECWVVYAKFWHGERIPRGLRAHQCTCNGFTLRPS